MSTASSAARSAKASTSRSRAPDPFEPAVDDRLVMPETRFEVIDGKVEYVAPADEPHGTRHSKISALLEAYVAEAYEVASDMLTRTSKLNDMAPDASVFPLERDPETGGRRLEELAFEVVSTERMNHAGTKARKLAKRGVRKVFAIDVKRKRAFVWSTKTDAWEALPPEGAIEDPALALPLPLKALVHAAKADDAMAEALLAKKNPILVAAIRKAEGRGKLEGKAEGKAQGKAEGKLEGKLEGKIETLLRLLDARDVRVPKKAEARIRAASEKQLDAWVSRALVCATVDELFEG